MPQYIDAANVCLILDVTKTCIPRLFNQYISPLDLTVYFNASHHQFWNSESTTNFGMSFSKLFSIGQIKTFPAPYHLIKLNMKRRMIIKFTFLSPCHLKMVRQSVTTLNMQIMTIALANR